MRANNPRLNLNTTELVLVKKSTIQVLDHHPALKEDALSLKEQVLSLRVLLDFHLFLDSQLLAGEPDLTIPGSLGPGYTDSCHGDIKTTTVL